MRQKLQDSSETAVPHDCSALYNGLTQTDCICRSDSLHSCPSTVSSGTPLSRCHAVCSCVFMPHGQMTLAIVVRFFLFLSVCLCLCVILCNFKIDNFYTYIAETTFFLWYVWFFLCKKLTYCGLFCLSYDASCSCLLKKKIKIYLLYDDGNTTYNILFKDLFNLHILRYIFVLTLGETGVPRNSTGWTQTNFCVDGGIKPARHTCTYICTL